jgi:hypothetical protein
MLHTYPLGHSHAFRSETLECKNESYQRRTYGTHRLTIVYLICRKVQTAGTYRPLDEMYTDCLHTWPNKLRTAEVWRA